jgi:hypothetical protein
MSPVQAPHVGSIGQALAHPASGSRRPPARRRRSSGRSRARRPRWRFERHPWCTLRSQVQPSPRRRHLSPQPSIPATTLPAFDDLGNGKSERERESRQDAKRGCFFGDQSPLGASSLRSNLLLLAASRLGGSPLFVASRRSRASSVLRPCAAGSELDDGIGFLEPPRLAVDVVERGNQGREDSADLPARLFLDHPRSLILVPVNVKRRMAHASGSLWTRPVRWCLTNVRTRPRLPESDSACTTAVHEA